MICPALSVNAVLGANSRDLADGCVANRLATAVPSGTRLLRAAANHAGRDATALTRVHLGTQIVRVL